MQMLLSKNWRITGVPQNYLLEKILTGVNPKTGKVANGKTWSTSGYYPTVESALNGYVTERGRKFDSTTIDEYIEQLKALREEIKSFATKNSD